MSTRKQQVLIVLAGLLLFVGIPLALNLWWPHAQEEGAKRNMARVIELLASQRGPETYEQWPALDGKNFVLAVVAYGALDVSEPEQRALLFLPGEMPAALDAEAYAEVTPESLRTKRFPHLTDYAGRMNTHAEYRITGDEPEESVPILACRHRGQLLLGYTDGDVRVATSLHLKVRVEAADVPFAELGLSDE